MAAVAFLLSVAFAAPCAAQDSHAQSSEDALTAREVFKRLESPALEILKKNTRLDMLDYWDVDSVYRAKNAMSGLSWLVDVKPGYLKVQITPVSSLEIKLLPEKKGEVVMTVYTIGGDRQASDSNVSFYDRNLKPLDTKKYFREPELKEFFDIPKGSLTTYKEIKEMIPFPTVEYSACAENDELSARLTVGEFMNIDDYNIVKLFLKPEISLRWNGRYK